ncbi:GPR1/FUN34/YaaH family transporter, partial [Streptomyces nymphaeiformis]
MSTASPAADGDDAPDTPPGRRFEPDLRSMTRINLRPIASPMPLGFFTIAIASVMTGCLQLGILGEEARTAVAFTVLPAFVLQLLVSFLAFGARDVIAATLMAVFAGSWLPYSLIMLSGAADGLKVLGVFNLALL